MSAAIHPLQRTYDEALSLVVESRNYLAYRHGDDPSLPAERRLAITLETLRLTARLTQAMAWLMGWRAVAAGEISRAELAAPGLALGGHALCLARGGGEGLPPGLAALMERSRALYERVARLDADVRRAERRTTGERAPFRG